jgi:hypothetical protein
LCDTNGGVPMRFDIVAEYALLKGESGIHTHNEPNLVWQIHLWLCGPDVLMSRER